MVPRGGVVMAGVLSVLGARRASAHEDDRWRISAEAQTRFPLSVGGRLRVETPSRIRIVFDGGVMPITYASVVDHAVAGGLGIEQTFGRIFTDVLTNAPTLRGSAGWRPWRDDGWDFEVGYESVAFGGDVVSQPALNALRALPAELRELVEDRLDYRLETTLHLFVLTAGYEWRVSPGGLMRWELGFAGTVAADVDVLTGAGLPVADPLIKEYTVEIDNVATDALTTYGFLPTLAFGIGYELVGASSPLD